MIYIHGYTYVNKVGKNDESFSELDVESEEIKKDRSLFSMLVRASVVYAGSKALTKSNMMKNTSVGKNASLATAISLGVAFVSNVFDENSSLAKNALSIMMIASAPKVKRVALENFSEDLYKKTEDLMKTIHKIDDFSRRFHEWGMESRQLVRERGKNETLGSVISDNLKQFKSFVVDNGDIKRSQAYNVIKNNPEKLLDSQYLTSHDYKKLSNLPPMLQDYVNDYTRINMKIGNTTYRTTSLADSLGYFIDHDKVKPKEFGNIDVQKVFREKLNEDLVFIKAQAEEFKSTLSGDVKKVDSLELYEGYLSSIFKAKELEMLEQNVGKSSDEIFELTKRHFIETDENLSLKVLLNKQAGDTHLSVGEYRKTIQNQIDEDILTLKREMKSDGLDVYFKPEAQSIRYNEEQTKKVIEFTDKINNLRYENRDLIHIDYSKKSSSEFVQDVFNAQIAKRHPLDGRVFSALGENSDKYSFISNMRVHKNIVKGSSGLMDTTVFDEGLVFKSALAVFENHFTPYFRALPFLPDSFRRFNAFALFKTNERIVNQLDDTSVHLFKEANYNVNDSIHAVKDMLGSLRYLIKDVQEQSEDSFSFKKSLVNLNKHINDTSGYKSDYGSGSNLKFEKRRFSVDELSEGMKGRNKRTILSQLTDMEAQAHKEYDTLSVLKSDNYKGFDAYDTPDSANSYHMYYLKANADGLSFDKSLRNKNNVVVIGETSYVRKSTFEGSAMEGTFKNNYVKAEDNVIYTKSHYAKQYQSDRAGLSVTTVSSKNGFYVSDKEVAKDYSLNDIFNAKNQVKTYMESDYNILPSMHGSVHDEANMLTQYAKRIHELKSVYDHAKLTDSKLQVDDIVMYVMGKNSRLKLSTELETFEINKVADSIVSKAQAVRTDFSKYKNFLEEAKKIYDEILETNFGSKTSEFIRTFNTRNLDSVDTTSDFYKFSQVDFLEQFDDIALKLKSADDDYFSGLKNLYKENEILNDSNLKKVLRNASIDSKTLQADVNIPGATTENLLLKREEILRTVKKRMISSLFKKSETYENFENLVGKDVLEGNAFINLDRLRHMDRTDYIQDATGTITRRAFANLDLEKDGLALTMKKIFSEFNDTSKYSNNANIFATETIEKIENVFNAIGIRKLDLSNKETTVDYLGAFLKKRVYNIALTVAAFSTVNSFSDILVPDEVPVIGEGITSAFGSILASVRYGFQVAINTTGVGWALRNLEAKFPGFFTDNGFFSVFDLSDTNEEAFGKYFLGDEVAVRKNRFWFTSGRNSFEGGEVETYRKSLLYSMQHRDSDVYDNKVERFFRKDFLPSNLLWTIADPYLEEKRLADKNAFFPKSEQKFTDIFLIGGLLSSTLGEAIKPTIYFHEDLWRVNKDTIINPKYDPNDPFSKNTVKINEPTILERTFLSAYNDTVRMSGMTGYLFDSMARFLTGTPYTTEGTYTLDSLDRHNSFSKKFEDLKLGGMIGTTEPIRRIYESNKLKNTTINPVPNLSPSWLPENYFRNFNFGVHSLGINNESMSNLSENADFYSKLKTLAINAPYSNEFNELKTQMISKLKSGSVDDKEAYNAYQAISFANGIFDNDVGENTNIRASLFSTSITIGNVTDIGSFTDTKGVRYKLAGIGPDIDNPYGGSLKAEELKNFMSELSRGKKVNAYFNSDLKFSVKTDEQGTYREIYAPQFDKYKTLRQESYLRENYNGHNPIQVANEAVSNFFKAGYLEKFHNKKDIVGRFVDESITTPQFKSWQDPLTTFLMPYLTSSSRDFGGYASALMMSTKVGDGSLLLPALETAAFLKGVVSKPFTPKHYAKEDLTQNSYQMMLNAQGKPNIFNLQGNENLNTLKNMLSPTERKYFKEMVNASDDETRQELFDAGSARLRAALQVAWKQQSSAAGHNFQNYSSSNDAEFKTVDLSDYSFSGDSSSMYTEVKDAIFGADYIYEKPIINSLIKNHRAEETDRINNILAAQKTVIKKTRILSTTSINSYESFY